MRWATAGFWLWSLLAAPGLRAQ
ncbi:MAG: hypothetical protein RJA19_1548, partial [Bacteroidota bacterium]